MMPPLLTFRHAMSAAATPGGAPSVDAGVDLRGLVADIPDFPRPGILFRDINPLLRHPRGWQEVMRQLSAVCERLQPDLIVGIESRGFIVGMALATSRSLGFVPVRKPGKLPGSVLGVDYELEYGRDRLEIPSDALAVGSRVLVVDDLLATGGTAGASAMLVHQAGCIVCGFAFLVELTGLAGRARLRDHGPVESLIVYS